MIVNEEKNFSFIHIPKCGGTDIKKYLSKYDDCNGLFNNNVVHLGGDVIDLSHLPFRKLKSLYPDVAQFVISSTSFAVMRDPIDRFLSAVSQYSKQTHGRAQHDMTDADIRVVINEIILRLKSTPPSGALPADLIHFQPQLDFISDDGSVFAQHIYTLNDLPKLKNDINRLFKARIFENEKPDILNERKEYKNSIFRYILTRVPASLRGNIRSILPNSVRLTASRLLLTKYSTRITLDSETLNFINNFYKDDFVLFKSLSDAPEIAGIELR
jgi:hypothetical protein